LKSIGFKKDKITFVPISGLKGINLETRDTQPEELKKWYNKNSSENNVHKTPNCLLDILYNFKSQQKPVDKPARICIYDYYHKN